MVVTDGVEEAAIEEEPEGVLVGNMAEDSREGVGAVAQHARPLHVQLPHSRDYFVEAPDAQVGSKK
eukprot:CAMPEP_0170545274 /NCGR_PEP_ID=MMETSP0211-20121228/3720_1 /TAXON_ID=311385 /ORGANISM="Pseudokeronopsis sp., Strain OXSARD2" /LENGTH=65 /DNA_ID=CAMNT_0010849129 /DNA_START=302 /DNA_END=499 /DNA_ORIENTATION=+